MYDYAGKIPRISKLKPLMKSQGIIIIIELHLFISDFHFSVGTGGKMNETVCVAYKKDHDFVPSANTEEVYVNITT